MRESNAGVTYNMTKNGNQGIGESPFKDRIMHLEGSVEWFNRVSGVN